MVGLGIACHKSVIPNLAIVDSFEDMSKLLSAGNWFSSTGVHWLLNTLCVEHYNWSKNSACTTSLLPKTPWVAQLKNLRKGSDLIFQFYGEFVFWHLLIWAKLSELGYFRRFPTNLIWCKLTWVGKVSHYQYWSHASSSQLCMYSVQNTYTVARINGCITVPSKVCAQWFLTKML
jgi:hypothetical protein